MKLIVGLGNPGMEYAATRHNAGFMAVDLLAQRVAPGEPSRSKFNAATVEGRIGGERALLIKPLGYMNRSGGPVQEWMRFHKAGPEDLLVIVDDIALPVGQIRLRASGGTGGHNGLRDIDRALGGAAYARCRVGVGGVPPGWRQDDWVLSRFGEQERGEVGRAVREAAEAAEVWATRGIEAAMNRFNQRAEAGDGPGPGRGRGRGRGAGAGGLSGGGPGGGGGEETGARAAKDPPHGPDGPGG